jgi:hypothetical protein
MKFIIQIFFETLSRKFRFYSNMTRITGTLHEDEYTFLIISHEGKIQEGIEVTGRQRRRRTKLLDVLKERRGYSHLKEEALDRTMWTTRFGRGFGPVVKQTTE